MAVAATTCKKPVHYYANHELSAIFPSSDITGENIDKEKPYKPQYYLHGDKCMKTISNGRFLSSSSKPTWLL